MTNMSKRKITGIIKYGTRSYAPAAQKFQEGGFVAVSKSYDWRDDPYEMMLLQQKAAQTNASIRAAGSGRRGSGSRSGSGSGSGSKKIETFERLEGGLPVTNDAINEVTAKAQEAFYNKVRSNEEGWASSTEGQIEFQKITNEGKRLEEKAKKEEDNFNAAFEKIDNEDRRTLAISAKEGVMAWDAITGKGQRISLDQYLDGVNKYKIMNVDEFAVWKKTEDTALQQGLTDEFLKENAVGHNTLKKVYIDGKDDQIQYAFINNRIVKKSFGNDSSPEEIIDAGLFKQGLSNLMNGTDFYKGMSVVPEAQTNKGLDVVNSIYGDIMSSAASQSQLGASLAAELLTDVRHLAEISKKEGTKAKHDYLEEQKKLLLVQKIVEKSTGKTAAAAGSDAAGEGSSGKANANPLFADLEAAYDPMELAQYTIGTDINTETKRKVSDVNMPMIRDGLSPANLKLEFDKDASPTAKKAANNFTQNAAIDAYSDKTELYTPSGDNFRTLFGNKEAVKQFIGEDAVIAPNETMPIVFMAMDKKGNIRSKDLSSLGPEKLEARKRFIMSTRGKLKDSKGKPYGITTRAENLLPGNIDSKAVKDTAEYMSWIQKGVDYAKYQQASAADPGNAEKLANFRMASDAKKVIEKTSAAFKAKFGQSPATMKPMLGTWIVFDNDRFNIKEAIEAKTGPNGFGSGMVIQATAEEKEFLQDTNGIDNFNWSSDSVYKMMVFTKVKSLQKAAAEQGEKLAGVAQYGDLSDRMNKFMDSRSEITGGTSFSNISLFLMQ